MFLAGILAGIIATIGMICLVMHILPATPDPTIMVGQTWYISGAGFVSITKVLHTGSFKEYGVGVNIQYMLKDGSLGHCTSKSLIQNGALRKEIKSFDVEDITKRSVALKGTDTLKNYSVYNKSGKTRILDVRFRNPR